MDPNATIEIITAAFHAQEWQECLDGIDDLVGWIERGGFLPDMLNDTTPDTALEWLAAMRKGVASNISQFDTYLNN